MGLSFRKSFGSGPFRVNFSKSGISYSVGVKGARVNVGPRGTYVNLSSHGISYRKKIGGSGQNLSPAFLSELPAVIDQVYHIASAEVDQLSDTDSKDFIAELTEKAGQLSYKKWFGIFPLIVFLCIIIFTSFKTNSVVVSPATDSVFVKVTNYDGVNIRAGASAKSAIIKAAAFDDSFPLLDSGTAGWSKITLQDTVGYISKLFSTIVTSHYDQVNSEELMLANPYAPYVFIGGLIGFIILIRWLTQVDKKRFEMELHYDMDEQFQQVYQQFSEHFLSFSRSSRIWQYLNAQRTNDYKRTGGAGKLIKRTSIMGISANQAPLPYFITNVSIPCLKLSNLSFYFLPERLLVKRGKTFAAVFYKNLQIDAATTRFIEDESVPHDAQIVDQTWRFVNKHGGPDRRFNNNRQIPICAYSEYTVTSDTGIYEVLTTSKKGAMDEFAGFLMGIGKLQGRMAVS